MREFEDYNHIRTRMMKSVKNRTRIVILILVLLNAACLITITTGSPTQTPQPPSETPTSSPIPTGTSTATAVSQAFFCVWNSTPTPVSPLCDLPSGQERDEFCVSQVPYTLIAIPTKDSYKVLTPGIVCSEAGAKNNYQLVTCTGPQSYSFSFQVCNSACIVPTATTAPAPPGICPEGFNYLSASNCCAAISGSQTGCTTTKFNLKACGPINCNKIKNPAVCNSTYGCSWVPGTGGTKSACLNNK